MLRSVKAPLAVLSEPVVLLFRALAPVAVFSLPVALLMSASSPRNVLPVMRSQPSWQTARTFGENAKQASASGMRNKVRRKGECLIEFRAIGVVVFDLNKFMVLCSVLSWLTQRLLRSERGGKRREKAFRTQPRIQTFWIRAKISPAWQANSVQMRIVLPNSINAVGFSSARTMKRFPSPQCASAIQ